MALALTSIGLWSTTGTNWGTAPFSTGSFTPPANSLLVVAVGSMPNNTSADPGQPTISGGSLTYTQRSNVTLTASWAIRMDVFTAPVGASPSSMTITVDDSANKDIYGYTVEVIAYTGHDTTTPIAGIVTSGTTDIGDGAESRTLSATPTTSDVTLAYCFMDCDTAPANPTLDAGWTKIHDGGSSPAGAGTLWNARRESSTSTTVSVTDVYTATGTMYKGGLLAFIVKAAGGGGGSNALAGTVAATSALTGALTVRAALAGTVAASSAVTGSLTVTAPLAGTVAAVSGLSGALSAAAQLAGTVAATSSLSGTLTVQAAGSNALAGTVASTSSLTGALTVRAPLAGTITAASSLTGTLTNQAAGQNNLAGTVAATSSLTGSLAVTKPLAGTVAATSALQGSLGAGTALSGTVQATSALSGALIIRSPLTGQIVAASSLAGSIGVIRPLAGTIASVAVLTGDLTNRGPVTAVGHLEAGMAVIETESTASARSGESSSGVLAVTE